MIYTEDDLIPISALQHVLYCEKQCALIHIEQVWSENRLTVEGKQLHEKVDDGGYKDLMAFQMSEIVFDGTIRFCDRLINAAPSTPIAVNSLLFKDLPIAVNDATQHPGRGARPPARVIKWCRWHPERAESCRNVLVEWLCQML